MSRKLWGLLVLCTVVVFALVTIGGCPKPVEETTEVAEIPPEVAAPETPAEPVDAAATEVGQFEWTAAPTVDDIPAGAVTGMMNGKPFIAQTVRVEKDDDDTYLLKISNKPLDDPNDPSGIIVDDDGWELTFTAPEGQPVKLTWAVADGKKGIDIEHVYYWYAQGEDKGPMSVNYPWGGALEITEWTVQEPAEGSDVLGSVKGRVVLVMDDDEKSWVAGEFDAPYYEW